MSKQYPSMSAQRRANHPKSNEGPITYKAGSEVRLHHTDTFNFRGQEPDSIEPHGVQIPNNTVARILEVLSPHRARAIILRPAGGLGRLTGQYVSVTPNMIQGGCDRFTKSS